MIGIGGSRGKTSVAFMLQAILKQAGMAVGSWTSIGVMAESEWLDGELHAWERCVLAARVGELDVLIQELFSPLTAAIGLPNDVYPLGILTTLCGNDDDCRELEESQREYQALHKLADATRHGGALVVNADDRPLLDLASTSEDREVILFALHAANPVLQRHLESGGSAIWLDDTLIVASDQGETRMIAEVGQLSSALGGALTIFVQNALAAAAAAMVIGVPPETIGQALASYQADPKLIPGSCNVTRIDRTTAIIDRADQLWSLKMLIRGIKNIPVRQTVILCGPLTIDDEELEEAGRLFATVPNAVLLLDWDESSERRRRLLHGMTSGNAHPLVIKCCGTEDAVNRLKTHIEPDDLAVILADDAAPYIEALV